MICFHSGAIILRNRLRGEATSADNDRLLHSYCHERRWCWNLAVTKLCVCHRNEIQTILMQEFLVRLSILSFYAAQEKYPWITPQYARSEW